MNKKNIGILSMQRIINYGSFLQAYGLKCITEQSSGAHVEFIDYKFERDITDGKTKEKHSFLSRIRSNKSLTNYVKKKRYFSDLEKSLVEDLKSIGIDERNYNKNIDSLIIGSDEVFNCLQPFPVGYSTGLFGADYLLKDTDVISYAASFGHTKLSDLKQYNIEQEIGQYLSNFKAISVRDENSFSIVKELTGRDAFIHLDPVLIYKYDFEIEQSVTNEKDYIIVYAYTGRMSETEEKYIREFARQKNKKIISIGNFSKIADKNIICHPFYVFSYFKNADYIITDTFHGSIFSMKMNAKFCTLIRESNRNKLVSLLTKLGQIDRAVESIEDIRTLYDKEIDYFETNRVIENERVRTMQYIKENL